MLSKHSSLMPSTHATPGQPAINAPTHSAAVNGAHGSSATSRSAVVSAGFRLHNIPKTRTRVNNIEVAPLTRRSLRREEPFG